MERKLIMNLITILRASCVAAFLLAAQHAVATPDTFTNDAAIKAFLHENFGGKNTAW